MIEALWYKKLRMNGIALDGPANQFVDHESVVFNTIIPSWCIKKKKHNSTNFHKTRGSVVNSREMRICQEPTRVRICWERKGSQGLISYTKKSLQNWRTI
jgi:hypothetical protein